MINNIGLSIRLASVGILEVPNIPDLWKLIFLYLADNIDCKFWKGPCIDYEYQSIDKLTDFFVYVCIFTYLYQKLDITFRLILAFALVFRLIGLWKFYKTRDARVLVQFPDYFRELTIVNLLFPGNIWWIIGVLIIKPYVEIIMHGKLK